MNVPPPPPGASAQMMQQYYALAGQWTSAMNAGNTAQAQQIYQQMLNLGQQVARSPGLLQYLQQYLQPALAFFGAGAAYIRLVMVSLGELIVGVITALFTPEVLLFLAIALFFVMVYALCMRSDARKRQRCQRAAVRFQLVARLQAAHRGAFGMSAGLSTG